MSTCRVHEADTTRTSVKWLMDKECQPELYQQISDPTDMVKVYMSNFEGSVCGQYAPQVSNDMSCIY
ncbi:hypothetical protein B7P43_G06789 [Cryptotermes secundus]|uniref:Uncharacterized protein n=1 Tax=Cryptotermes secundus TaxID=105785 RepID=A0A2J7PDB2_9NEOP|nr:hypothetical protein B7P43_G06789 [Cryptotermes secundus]